MNVTGDSVEGFLNNRFKKILPLGISGIAAALGGDLFKAGLNTILNVFNKQTQTVSKVNLTTDTKHSLSGIGTTDTNTGAIPYNMPVGKNMTGIELGTWNLEDNPTVYIHPVGVLKTVYGYDTDEHQYTFKSTGKYGYKVVFNPQLKELVKSYSVEILPVHYTVPLNAIMPIKDFGKIGSEMNTGTSTDFGSTKLCTDTVRTVYSNKELNIYATYAGLRNRYGDPSTYNNAYRYVYGPSNDMLIRGTRFSVSTYNQYVKVTVKYVANINGKETVVENTRTYLPKYEWDPDMLNTYGSLSMSMLQSRAAADDLLR